MKRETGIIGSGIITAVAASLCCIAPVVSLLAGVGGIASTFSWLEPLRPYLIGLSVIMLGFAWYQKQWATKKDDCGCETATSPKFLQTKTFLVLVTLFAALMIAFPYYSKVFYPKNERQTIAGNKSAIGTVELTISGMSCEACEEEIKHEVYALPGIVNAEVYYQKRNAMITFDSSRINVSAIENAVNATGYKITNSKIK
jgi:copper chaperone CopZ